MIQDVHFYWEIIILTSHFHELNYLRMDKLLKLIEVTKWTGIWDRRVSLVLPFSEDRWIIDFAGTAPRAVSMLSHPLSNSCYSFFPLIRCVHWWHLRDWQIVILLKCGLIYTEPIISRQIDQLDIAMLIVVFIILTPDWATSFPPRSSFPSTLLRSGNLSWLTWPTNTCPWCI